MRTIAVLAGLLACWVLFPLRDSSAQQSLIPAAIQKRWTVAQIADGFSRATVQRLTEIRVHLVADPRATQAETDCVRGELGRVLRDWTHAGSIEVRFVDDAAANLIVNFNRDDHGFLGRVDARLKVSGARLASFLTTEALLPAYAAYLRSQQSGRGWLRIERAFDFRRIHSGFFVMPDDSIDLAYVWVREASITGEFARGDWPDSPYGVSAGSGGTCFAANQRVAAIELMLAHAVGAAVPERMDVLRADDALNLGFFDGRNMLLARQLYHRTLTIGLEGNDLKRRVERLLE